MRRLLPAMAILISLLAIPASYVLISSSHSLPSILLALLILFTSFFAISGLAYFLKSRAIPAGTSPASSFPAVAIVSVSYNEDPEKVRRSLSSLKKMEWGGPLNFYLLDDSSSPEIVSALSGICRSLGVNFVHRDGRRGYKGGALNDFLSGCREEFAVIFDSDERLENPGMLMECMGHFQDPNVAFVQTGKATCAHGTFQEAMEETNSTFFDVVVPVNAAEGFAMFLGSCGIIRKSAWEKVKFPEILVEDVGFAFRIIQANLEGRYVNRAYARGEPIRAFSQFRAKHARYIYGITQLIPFYLSVFPSIPLKRHFFYFVQIFGLHYLSAAQFLISILMLALLQGAGTSPEILAGCAFATFFPPVSVVLLGWLKGLPARTSLLAYFLNFSLIIPRMFSATKALLGLKTGFSPAKNSGGHAGGFLIHNIPELLLALIFAYFSFPLSAASLVLGWWALLYAGPAAMELTRH